MIFSYESDFCCQNVIREKALLYKKTRVKNADQIDICSFIGVTSSDPFFTGNFDIHYNDIKIKDFAII